MVVLCVCVVFNCVTWQKRPCSCSPSAFFVLEDYVSADICGDVAIWSLFDCFDTVSCMNWVTGKASSEQKLSIRIMLCLTHSVDCWLIEAHCKLCMLLLNLTWF